MSDENKTNGEKDYSDLIDKYSIDYLKNKKQEKDESETAISTGRKEKVANFSLNFDADSEIPNDPEPVSHDKGIYFAAYSGKNAPKAQVEPKKKEAEDVKAKFASFKKNVSVYFNILRKNTVAYTATYVGVILLASVLLSAYGLSCINDIFAIRNPDELVTVTIPDNAKTGDVINVLHDNDLVKHPWFCKVYAGVMGYEDNYLNGMHQLNAKMGLEGMLKNTKEAKAGAETVDVTFPEGWSVAKIAKRLEEYKVCSADLFLKTLEEANFNYEFLKTPLDSTNRYRKLEGYLFLAQYNFYVNESPASVVKKFFEAYNENVMTDENIARAKELGLTMDQVLTIASLIQREAANTEQMYLVSSVIHNRLNSNSYPSIGCEAVDVYYQREILPNAPTARAEELFTGYSTYATTGLPNGPICNPGADAIDAALNPEKTPYFYFCHDKKGNIYMAQNQSQHDANMNRIYSGETENQ